MLTATKLAKSYATVKAVRNVSLTLEAGEIVAIVGESGSGKSTLLSLLAGLTDADTGEVRLNDERVPGPSEVLVAGHEDIRLVHQEYQLMPNSSIRENIDYALRFFEQQYRQFRVDELVKLCRLTDVQHRLPRQVSGGEKQRTAIARAIAEKPAILLLDEPFSHLDLPNRMLVRDLLFDLVRQEKTACLLVTHDATDALSIASTLGIMRNGKVIQIGTPLSVYQRPASAYAARMTGPATILKAKYLPLFGLPHQTDSDELICIRPEQILIAEEGVPATVRAVYFKGSHYEVEVMVARHVSLRLLTTQANILTGQSIQIGLNEQAIWPVKN